MKKDVILRIIGRKLESHAGQFITQRLVYKRFSSAKQYGSSKGGATHVIAPLHSRAETEADRGVSQELLFKEEFDIRINMPKLRCRGIRSLTTEVEIKHNNSEAKPQNVKLFPKNP